MLLNKEEIKSLREERDRISNREILTAHISQREVEDHRDQSREDNLIRRSHISHKQEIQNLIPLATIDSETTLDFHRTGQIRSPISEGNSTAIDRLNSNKERSPQMLIELKRESQ